MTREEKIELLKRANDQEARDSTSMSREEKIELLRQSSLNAPISQDQDISAPEALGVGAARGATYGLMDEGAGALEAGKGVFRGEYSGDEIKDNYRAGRQKSREYQAEAESSQPVATGAGMVVGGGAASLVPGYNLGKAAKLGKYGQTAAMGALQGYGESEAEGPISQGQDALTGAATGMALQKGLEVVPGREKLAAMLQKRAYEKAVKSSGAMTKEFRTLNKNNLLEPQGKHLLENKIVTPFASLEDVAERSDVLREKAGSVIGSIIDGADSLIERAKTPILEAAKNGSPQDKLKANLYSKQVDQAFGYSFENVAKRIEALNQRDSKIGASVAYHAPQLQTLANTFRSFRTGSLREGLRNKTEQRKMMKSVESLAEEYKQEVYDIISDELEKAVSKLPQLSAGVEKLQATIGGGKPLAQSSFNKIGDSPADIVPKDYAASPPKIDLGKDAEDIVGKFRSANKDYAASATAQKMANNRLGNTMSNRDFGLTTAIASGAGMAAAGAPGAVAMGGFNNFMRKYGSTLQATGYDKLAKMLKATPDSFGKYKGVLQQALLRGANEFLLSNQLIAKQDPEYRGFLEKILDSEEQQQ